MTTISESITKMSRDDWKTLLICAAILVLFLISDGIVLLGGLLILVAALVSKKGRTFFSSLGTLKPRNWKEFLMVVLGFFVLIIPINVLIMLSVPSSNANVVSEDIGNSGGITFVLLLVSVLVAAVLEEIIFRGYLLTRLSYIFGTSHAAIALTTGVTSIIFGAAHFYQTGLQSALMIGSFSLVVGVIFIKTQFNLGYALAIHVLNNLLFTLATRFLG